MLLRMKTPDPAQFASARQFAAWIGLTPKDHSTVGQVRLGVITRAGVLSRCQDLQDNEQMV
jgi:transposase